MHLKAVLKSQRNAYIKTRPSSSKIVTRHIHGNMKRNQVSEKSEFRKYAVNINIIYVVE